MGAPTIEITYELFAALCRLPCRAPLKQGANVYSAQIPWSDVLKARRLLEEGGYDWRAYKATNGL